MADGTVFPAFLRLEHQRDGNAKASFLADIESTLGSAEARFKSFSTEAQRQVDAALAVQRNSGGSLDLGVDQMQAAAKAQQARALAAREVAQATAIAAREQGDLTQQTRLAVAATEALAREEEEAARAALSHAAAVEQVQAVLNRQASATDMVVGATGRGTQANHLMVNSTRALRVATVQAGQQVQDMGIMLYSGQRASIVFAQQLPQLAFALSMLDGSANKTHARIGKFATFLAGPWGLAVGLAVGVLGNMVAGLFDAEKAADKSGNAMQSLRDKLDLSKNSYEALTDVVAEYNKQQDKSTSLTYDAILAAETQAQTNLTLARSKLLILQASDPTANSLNATDAASAQAAQDRLVRFFEKRIGALEQELRDAGVAGGTERVRRQTDQRYAIEIGFNEQIARLEEKRSKGIIEQVEYERERLRLINAQTAALKAFDDARKASRPASAGAQASLGDMKALVRQLFPGAAITSGLRPGDKGDHGAGRALDFVPAGGMDRYTTAEVEQILRDAGVDIRRNAGGTKQMFGPGRAAEKPGDHDDHFHFAWQGGAPDPDKVAAAVARADEILRAFGEKSAESIARVNERFDEQPRLIDQAARATRELEVVIADLADKKPIGFEQMIADAQEAKAVIEDALVRPFRELAEDSARHLEIERLVLAGREREADVVEAIWRMEDRIGELTADQAAAVRDVVEARYDELRAIERLRREQDAYLGATQSVRGELEAIFSGRGSIANFGQIFRDLQSKVLVEKLFGDTLEELDDSVKAQFGRAVDQLEDEAERTARSFHDLADAATGAAARMTSRDLIAGTSFLQAPTIDPALRRAILNADGSRSTIETTSFATELGEVLIPTIVDGVRVSAEEAFRHFEETGEHLGIFESPGEATAFARALSEAQGHLQDFSAATADAASTVLADGVAANNNVIEVTADRGAAGINGLTPERYFSEMTRRVVDPLLDGLDEIFGVQFFGALKGAMAGALYGYSVGGTPGGVLGALKGLNDTFGADLFGDKLAGSIGGALSGAIKGSGTGSMVAGLGDAFGINLSNTGAQIGGAVGSFLPIPGGDIIGAIAGGLLGKLFGSTKYGTASLSGAGDPAVRAKGDGRASGASTLGGAVQEALANIADRLGADLGGFRVSIGTYKDSIRVSPSGMSGKLKGGDVRDFGDDQGAAIAFAVMDALKDGAIKGIRASTQRLLTAGSDAEKALQDAMDFEGVFRRLAEKKDPVGAALKALEDEFKRLRELFDRANASAQERAEIEELYTLERGDIIKQETERLTGSLKSLLADLTVGNSALSLRDRKALADAEYSPLAARVAAGDTTAYDAFAEAARTLLQIERELSGSQTGYFDLLGEVTDLTRSTLEREEARGAAVTNDNQGVVDAVNAQTADLNAQLSAANDNLGTMIALMRQGKFNIEYGSLGGGW